MTKTVYVLGAGVNKSIRIKYGVQPSKLDVSPPLARDFFQVAFAMAHGRFARKYQNKFEQLPLYIKNYWKKSFSALATSDFDLEECFTLIELQLRDALQNERESDIERLTITDYELKQILYEVLSEFGELLDPFLDKRSDRNKIKRFGDCETFRTFGEILYRERPIILSFNYDDFIEGNRTCIEPPNL